jgi:hypothetical protein
MIPPPSIWSRMGRGEWPGRAFSSEELGLPFADRRRRVCEICGQWPAHAHHANYEKPRAITFLCPSHHRRLHNLLLERFASLDPQEYTQQFHDQVLADLHPDPEITLTKSLLAQIIAQGKAYLAALEKLEIKEVQ